jgi:hypothetical protein
MFLITNRPCVYALQEKHSATIQSAAFATSSFETNTSGANAFKSLRRNPNLTLVFARRSNKEIVPPKLRLRDELKDLFIDQAAAGQVKT